MSESTQRQRPTSPHLSIYKPQINSIMSIFHRFTGLGLFFGFAILSWWLVVWVFSGFDPYWFEIANLPYVKFCINLLIISFFYHFCNGIRHLFWDVGKGYSLPTLFKTSYLVLGATLVLTILFFIVG